MPRTAARRLTARPTRQKPRALSHEERSRRYFAAVYGHTAGWDYTYSQLAYLAERLELAREVTGEAEPCAFERQFRDAANEAWTNALPLRPADLPAPLPPTPHASARRSSLVQPAVAEGGA